MRDDTQGFAPDANEPPHTPRGELRWSKTTLFFVFHLHLFGSLMMLQNAVDSLFFSTVGVEHLPTVRFLMAAVMLPLTLVYDRISANDHDSRGFAPLLVTCGVVVVALGMLYLADERAGSFGLMVASPVVQAFLLAEFWNFANRYFTIRESKRVFPQLFAAASLGGVAAGFATSALASITSTQNLLFIWFAIALLGLLFIRTIRENVRPSQVHDPMADLDLAAARAALQRRPRRSLARRIRDAVVSEPLVTGIVGLSFMGTVVLFLAEYAYYDVFTSRFTRTDELTEFLGFWSAISSAINFGLSMFLLPRMAAWLGVRNLTLIQPVLAVLVFVGLIVSPMLAMAVVGYLAIQSRNVVEETNEKFLYKGLAPELAQVVRGRSEGGVKPLAAAAAALVLFLFGTADSPVLELIGSPNPALAVSLCGVVLAIAYIGIAQVARAAYPRAIVERIRTRTFDPSAETPDALALEGTESRAVLREQLGSNDAEIVRFAAEYLAQADVALAAGLVRERLTADDTPDDIRADLLELLARWAPRLHADDVQAAVEPWLGHADDDVRAAALRAWSALPDAATGPVVDALDDPSPDVRREAIAALCTHWDLMHVARGARRLDTLLQSEDEEARLGAVVVLGRLADRRHLRMLSPLLSDDAARVRLRAAHVINERADRSCAYLVDDLVDALRAQREPAVRLHLLDALLKIGEPTASRAVLESGDGVPERVRRRSARFLAGHIDENVELLQATLRSPERAHGERVLAAQALTLAGRRYQHELAETARRELTEAYGTLRDQVALESMLEVSGGDPERRRDAVELLELALEDRRREALEIVIEIVGFASQHPDFDTIRTYCFSDDPVARAYAIEALDNLADRPLFELLLPFLTLDPNDEIELALGAIGQHLGLDRDSDDVLARRVHDRHPWVRACALFAATRLAHEAAAEAAVDYADDPDPIVRETAAWARTA